ncbi:MAG: ROK family transcriptional regulator [Planctomycetes bacterium]|nr:ROK family transcriptional regulator [Planctomycetota bacterium]
MARRLRNSLDQRTRTTGGPGGGVEDASSQTLGAAAVRAQHRGLLLRLVWQERLISRADLARRTGLSRSSISAIVADLLETGLVKEIGAGDSRGGRRPILLGFDDEALAIVGIDMGATHVAVAVTDLRAQIKAWALESHDVRNDPAGALDLLRKLIDGALHEAKVHKRSLVGMGVAVPSPVRPDDPDHLSPVLVPKWEGVSPVEFLETAYGVPVVMENDANLGALAEQWWGAGQDGRDLAYVKVATGVGAGLIIHGDIYRGTTGIAGEIGHIPVDPSAGRCVCGLDGCLNLVVGTRHLVERVQHLRTSHPNSPLPRRGLNVGRIVESAFEGDSLARAVVEEAGHHLAIGVAALMNLINPATVVFGGSLTRAGDMLLRPLLRKLGERTPSSSVNQSRFVISSLGIENIAIGAATLVLHAALGDLTLFPRAKQNPHTEPSNTRAKLADHARAN